MTPLKPLFTLVIHTHFFKVLNPTPYIQSISRDFSRKYVLMALTKEPGKGWVMRPSKTFALQNSSGSEFRFHINQLEPFQTALTRAHIQPAQYLVETMNLFTPVKIKALPRKGWAPRDYQEPICDYLTAIPKNTTIVAVEDKDARSKLVGIQTGRGKTSTALFSVSRIGYRTVVLIKPTYIEKWCSDIQQVLDVKPMEIMTVQGGDQLKGLIDMAMNNELTSKFIIISTRTHQNYIKLYESNPSDMEVYGYDCPPDRLMEVLGAGSVIMDEVHQEFYATFKSLLFMHVPVTIGLSATLVNNNRFLEEMYEVVFPKATRYASLEHDRYIKAYSIAYRFKQPDRIRTTEFGSTMYSHAAFEKSILRYHPLSEAYKALVKHTIDIAFIQDYKPGDKLSIFASSIAMCTELVKHIKRTYPRFDTRRYVQDDPYENVIDSDIRVSTLGSSGTAIDIPGLRAVILTVNILSIQGILQGSGRLRPIKDRDVKFFWLYCEQLDKHVSYHKQRMITLQPTVASIKELAYPGIL